MILQEFKETVEKQICELNFTLNKISNSLLDFEDELKDNYQDECKTSTNKNFEYFLDKMIDEVSVVFGISETLITFIFDPITIESTEESLPDKNSLSQLNYQTSSLTRIARNLETNLELICEMFGISSPEKLSETKEHKPSYQDNLEQILYLFDRSMEIAHAISNFVSIAVQPCECECAIKCR